MSQKYCPSSLLLIAGSFARGVYIVFTGPLKDIYRASPACVYSDAEL